MNNNIIDAGVTFMTKSLINTTYHQKKKKKPRLLVTSLYIEFIIPIIFSNTRRNKCYSFPFIESISHDFSKPRFTRFHGTLTHVEMYNSYNYRSV